VSKLEYSIQAGNSYQKRDIQLLEKVHRRATRLIQVFSKLSYEERFKKLELFFQTVINRWNQLDQRVVDASSISAFKGWLNKIRDTRMGFFMD